MSRFFNQRAEWAALAVIAAAAFAACAPGTAPGGDVCAFPGVASEAAGPDFLIRSATLIDGSGRARFAADVRVTRGVISAIGSLCPDKDEPVLDAQHRILAPGFIDTHSHHDRGMLESSDARSLRAVVSQGVTTIVLGQDGMSSFPVSELAGDLARIPVAVNVASYTGHGTLRTRSTGSRYNRKVTPEELGQMKFDLAADMEAGSLGLSSGLEYDPGIYSDQGELTELASVLHGFGGRYISHMRSEDKNLDAAIDELLQIGEAAGIPVQISHFKVAYIDFWGEAPQFLEKLDAARARGIDVTADVYPYDFWQSTLAVLLPERNFDDVGAAQNALDHLAPADGLTLTMFEPDPALVGQTVQQIAEARKQPAAKVYLDLIKEAYAGVRIEEAFAKGQMREMVLGRSMSDPDVAAIMAWPHTNIASDGFSGGGHPRGYGAFPRAIRLMVRDLGLVSLEEMVRKCSRLGAENVGLVQRGLVVPGAPADLVLFNEDEISDEADIQDPTATASGILGVWVNGVRVWEGGNVTGAYPGRFLKRGD